MSVIVTLLMSRNVRNGENLNEVKKGAPYKVEKLTKIEKLAKFAMGLENIQIG